MNGLLRADFRRVFKDKLMIVMAALAVVFALTTPLIYVLAFSGMDELTKEAIVELLGMTAKDMFFESFSLGNNLGLIAPVLLAIVLCKDFSHGTVRNKIIAGKSRGAVYMSMLIVCSAIFVGIMLLQGFITLGFSLIFFEYQPGGFALNDLWFFLESLAFELLIMLFVSSMLTWLCANMRNVGLVIVLYVAAIFSLIMESALVQGICQVLEWTDGDKLILAVLRTLDKLNVMSAAALIGAGTSYSLENVFYITVPTVLCILCFTVFGLLRFMNRDFK